MRPRQVNHDGETVAQSSRSVPLREGKLMGRIFGRRRRNAEGSADSRLESASSAQEFPGTAEEVAALVVGLLAPELRDLDGRLELLEAHLRNAGDRSTTPDPAAHADTSYDETPDFDAATADVLHAHHLRRYFGCATQSPPNGTIRTVTIVGELKDGSIAWHGDDDSVCGRTTRDVLEGVSPVRGQTLRARVVTHLWGCHLAAVVPLAGKRSSSPTDFSREHPVPQSVEDSWQKDLQTGDIVLARVPYDGYRPVDDQGRIVKHRPVVFVRWEDGYALCRAIYDADSYVAERELGQPLVDTVVLTKESVVRNAEYDLDPTGFLRRLGTVGPRDRRMMNLPDAAVAPPSPSNHAPVNRELEIPVDYATPDVILFDQMSVARIVGEARIDMAVELSRLRDGGDAPGYIIGSDAQPGWRKFQHAAAERGWGVVVVEDRKSLIARAESLAREHGAEVITVVSHLADFVADLENLGYVVNVVSTTCHAGTTS